MTKLASVIEQIVAASEEPTKLAAHSLSQENASPSISTELSVALVKTAEALKAAHTDISHADLKKFLERLKNA